MKKSLLWILVLILSISVVATFSFVGCKTDTEEEAVEETQAEEAVEEEAVEEEVAEEEQVTVSLQSWLVVEGASKDTMEVMIAEFEKENPDIKVELIGVPYAETLNQSIIKISGGNPPDIMQLNPVFSLQVAALGALEDLNPYFTQEELSDIPAGSYNDGIIGEELLTVPWQLGSIVVLANKSILGAAGLPIEIPKTWTEFTEAVRVISDLGEDYYGFGARTSKSANSALWFFPVLYGFGEQFEDSEGNITFNTQEAIAALDWYKELGTTGQTPIGMGVVEVRNLFAQGQVGFIFDGPWMRGILRSITEKGEVADEDYIVGLMPKAADGNRYGIGNNHVLAISKQSEVKEQAVRLIKFLTQDEEITKFYYENTGAIPVYKKLLADPLYAEDSFAQAFIQSAEFVTCIPSRNVNFNASLDFIANAMQTALLGGDTAEAAEAANNSIKTLYGQE